MSNDSKMSHKKTTLCSAFLFTCLVQILLIALVKKNTLKITHDTKMTIVTTSQQLSLSFLTATTEMQVSARYTMPANESRFIYIVRHVYLQKYLQIVGRRKHKLTFSKVKIKIICSKTLFKKINMYFSLPHCLSRDQSSHIVVTYYKSVK